MTDSQRIRLSGREYRGLERIDGSLVFMKNTHPVGYNELVQITDKDGNIRSGQVLDTSDEAVCVQVFDGTSALNLPDTRMVFMGEPITLGVTDKMLGRVMDGLGNMRDGNAAPMAEARRDVNGSPINPTARIYPRDFIQTGISCIDGMTTLIQGQKLPIFSANGLDHNILAAQIARQAKVRGADSDFAIVFVAMGIKYDTAQFFIDSFESSGVLDNVALFLSLADDPSIERLITPKSALTLAEFLAFDKGKQVLVIMTDMTNYCESLREISTLRGEIPSRKGYPGYLYSNLAELYERSGKIEGREGSITQLPILTMPNDDISHPIPDLTGYITEGQIVFSRQLASKGVYPPVDVLPSLSRLMKDGIGEGMTRSDHPHLSNQLFASYSHVKDVRNLASVIGEEELTDLDRCYMRFGEFFEQRFLKQGTNEDRSIEQTLDLGWKALGFLPREELSRLSEDEIDSHYTAAEA
ncbi:MAG: V-type ATP synthase subunit B [Sphaerochaetaceae bacterium]|jgi:V/A-type H+-transporting ATPase subunit B|nr:V-type ATP synthase subunit B [Sphaerochaetaceae bacterium]